MLDDAPPLPLRLTATYCRQSQQQGSESFIWSTAFTAFSLDCVTEQLLRPAMQGQQPRMAGPSATSAAVFQRVASQQQQQLLLPHTSQAASQSTLEYGTHPSTQQGPSQQGSVARPAAPSSLAERPDRRCLRPAATASALEPSQHRQCPPAPAPSASMTTQTEAARKAKQKLKVRAFEVTQLCLPSPVCKVIVRRVASQWMKDLQVELLKHRIYIKDEAINPTLNLCFKQGMDVLDATASIVAAHSRQSMRRCKLGHIRKPGPC